MSGTPSNLIQGVGELYTGAFGATEPAASGVGSAPASAAWTDCGFTRDGMRLTYTPTYSPLQVDQLIDTPGRRLTGRDFAFATALAEATLANLKLALNNSGTAATGSGWETYEPNDLGPENDPTYLAVLVDGFAEGFSSGVHYRRRVIIRKALATEAVELAYTKDGQTVIPVTFMAHYVSSSIRPWIIVDGGA